MRSRRAIARALAARVLTGPVGHGLAGLADWAQLAGRALWRRAQR